MAKVLIMAFFYRPTELRKFSLEKFITVALPPNETIPVTDTEALRDAWKNQIQTVLKVLPRMADGVAQWQRASQPREAKLAGSWILVLPGDGHFSYIFPSFPFSLNH